MHSCFVVAAGKQAVVKFFFFLLFFWQHPPRVRATGTVQRKLKLKPLMPSPVKQDGMMTKGKNKKQAER